VTSPIFPELIAMWYCNTYQFLLQEHFPFIDDKKLSGENCLLYIEDDTQ